MRIKVKEKHVTKFVNVPDRPELVKVSEKVTKTTKTSKKKKQED